MQEGGHSSSQRDVRRGGHFLPLRKRCKEKRNFSLSKGEMQKGGKFPLHFSLSKRCKERGKFSSSKKEMQEEEEFPSNFPPSKREMQEGGNVLSNSNVEFGSEF